MTEKHPKENLKCKSHENEVQKVLKYLALFLSISKTSYFLELFSQKSRHFMFFLQPGKKEDLWSILRNLMEKKSIRDKTVNCATKDQTREDNWSTQLCINRPVQ